MNNNYEFCGFDTANNIFNNKENNESTCKDFDEEFFNFYNEKKSKKSKKRKKQKKAMKRIHKELKDCIFQLEQAIKKANNHEIVLKQHSTEIDELNKKYIKLLSAINSLKKNFREEKFNNLILSEDISERKKIAKELLLSEEK